MPKKTDDTIEKELQEVVQNVLEDEEIQVKKMELFQALVSTIIIMASPFALCLFGLSKTAYVVGVIEMIFLGWFWIKPRRFIQVVGVGILGNIFNVPKDKENVKLFLKTYFHYWLSVLCFFSVSILLAAWFGKLGTIESRMYFLGAVALGGIPIAVWGENRRFKKWAVRISWAVIIVSFANLVSPYSDYLGQYSIDIFGSSQAAQALSDTQKKINEAEEKEIGKVVAEYDGLLKKYNYNLKEMAETQKDYDKYNELRKRLEGESFLGKPVKKIKESDVPAKIKNGASKSWDATKSIPGKIYPGWEYVRTIETSQHPALRGEIHGELNPGTYKVESQDGNQDVWVVLRKPPTVEEFHEIGEKFEVRENVFLYIDNRRNYPVDFILKIFKKKS